MGANIEYGHGRRRACDRLVVGVRSAASHGLAGAVLDRCVGCWRLPRSWSRACAGSSFRGRFSLWRSRPPPALRRWRPGRSRRWRRVVGRGVLVVGLALGGLALLTALGAGAAEAVRALTASAAWSSAGPTTSAPRRSPLTRRTAGRSSLRRGTRRMRRRAGRFRISRRRAVCRRRSSGLPSFMFASFGSVATHATAATPVSAAQRTWPVVFFSPGLSVPREAVHGSLRRPCQPRLRGRGPQRPLRVSGLGPGGRQGRRSDDPPGRDGAAAASVRSSA